jgi:hypothetical protein
MPLTVVIPAAVYKNKVFSTYSMFIYLGALDGGSVGGTCPCISAKPGIRNLPVPSIKVASESNSRPSEGDIMEMFLPFITTVWFLITLLSVIGMTETFVKAITFPGIFLVEAEGP